MFRFKIKMEIREILCVTYSQLVLVINNRSYEDPVKDMLNHSVSGLRGSFHLLFGKKKFLYSFISYMLKRKFHVYERAKGNKWNGQSSVSYEGDYLFQGLDGEGDDKPKEISKLCFSMYEKKITKLNISVLYFHM